MQFPLMFGDEIRTVTKIEADDFTPVHRDHIARAQYQAGRLVFPGEKWRSAFLGAGEEKAVFCVCDHHNRVFALEALDERTYLNGRFVGGVYFFDLYVEGLSSVKRNPEAFAGLQFTGKTRIREYVYGYEWARFQFDPRRRSWIDGILTTWLRMVFSTKFEYYRAHYKDVHDRNIMFELRSPTAKGFPVFVRDVNGYLRYYRVGVQPIDVR